MHVVVNRRGGRPYGEEGGPTELNQVSGGVCERGTSLGGCPRALDPGSESFSSEGPESKHFKGRGPDVSFAPADTC